MTLSRTARILIAVLLLAAAAFFWVNFFSQEQPSSVPVTATTTPTSSTPAPSATTSTPASTTGTSTATTSGAATSPSSSSGGTVVAPTRPAVATHDLQVAALPFLVTEPPASTSSAAGGSAAASTSTGGTQQTASAQRMNVNPFSPIVVQAAAAPPAAPAKPPATQQVTTAAAPANATATPAKLAEAPAPQPVAPPPPQASGLPHALPTGMLPTTPSVLQSTRAQATSSAPKDLGAIAAVREPESSSGTGNLASVSQTGLLNSAPAVPGVLGPGQAAAATAANASNVGGNAPLQAGNDSLSRYLRDNNVRFTGTVLGPVSVGVFRSSQYKTPVVVPLGQDLPDTKITLTDLRGHEAVFSLNDSTQSLSLDLRR